MPLPPKCLAAANGLQTVSFRLLGFFLLRTRDDVPDSNEGRPLLSSG